MQVCAILLSLREVECTWALTGSVWDAVARPHGTHGWVWVAQQGVLWRVAAGHGDHHPREHHHAERHRGRGPAVLLPLQCGPGSPALHGGPGKARLPPPHMRLRAGSTVHGHLHAHRLFQAWGCVQFSVHCCHPGWQCMSLILCMCRQSRHQHSFSTHGLCNIPPTHGRPCRRAAQQSAHSQAPSTLASTKETVVPSITLHHVHSPPYSPTLALSPL